MWFIPRILLLAYQFDSLSLVGSGLKSRKRLVYLPLFPMIQGVEENRWALQ